MKDLQSEEGSAALELSCGAFASSLVEEINGAVMSAILEPNGQDQSAGVMQEPVVPLEGFQVDADVRTEQRMESEAWKSYLVSVMREMRTASWKRACMPE